MSVNDFYIYEPSKIRANKDLMNLDPFDRGVYRDILDLMWLTKTKCSLPLKKDIISSRINTTEAKLTKSINKLIKIGLIEKAVGNEIDYIVSPLLEKQKNGIFDESVDISNITRFINEKSKRNPSLTGIGKTDLNPYRFRGYIDVDDLLYVDKFKDWIPTSRFTASGEVFKVNNEVIDMMQKEVPEINPGLILPRIYNYLIKEENSNRRPTYANMMNFIINFCKRNLTTKLNTESEKSEVEMFEVELLKALGE